MPKVTKQKSTAKQMTRKHAAKAKASDSAWPGDTGIRINLYGRSGTGKTTLWGTFPKPILCLVASGSNRPGELMSLDTPENRKVIFPKILRVGDYNVSDQIEALLDGAEEKYQTVVLDHASGLQDMVLREILGLEKAPEQLSWGLATIQQYGQVALQVKERLRSLLDLSSNVVIVAQEREFNTESNGDLLLPYVASALIPSIVGWLNPAVDYICQTFIRPQTTTKRIKAGKKITEREVRTGKVEYCLRTAPHDVFTTKFRLPKGTPLPDVIVDPDYDKIMALIRGGAA